MGLQLRAYRQFQIVNIICTSFNAHARHHSHTFVLCHTVVCTREASDQFPEQMMALLGSKKRFIRKFDAYVL